MRFEQSIDINAPQEAAWAVVSDVERWPERTASISSVKLLNSPPFGLSSQRPHRAAQAAGRQRGT